MLEEIESVTIQMAEKDISKLLVMTGKTNKKEAVIAAVREYMDETKPDSSR